MVIWIVNSGFERCEDVMATEQAAHQQNPDYEPPRRVSVDTYLRLSEELPGKYEYFGGLMYPRWYPPGSHRAMAGGTRAHARLMTRMLTALEAHLRGGLCNVYPSDMRLYVADHTYFYPDAFVVCDEDAMPNRVDERDAMLVVEVRSASTSDFDRGDKFEAYRQLPGLREYLLLDNRRVQANLFRLGDDGAWRYITYTEGADLVLESVGLHLPLADLYLGIPLDRDDSPESNT
jgi:Uma2 family endonuclease